MVRSEGTKIDNIKPQVCFVFPMGHGVNALKDWLGSSKRGHVMQSFAPTCIIFISDTVQAKTMGNAC